ncbi:hypothetical protein [Photorhabdus cinerea]|uniref:hypothetical protein n=1 Tax=Photorhabdus cinerea TaxID=471575 RepID=UPI001408BA0E
MAKNAFPKSGGVVNGNVDATGYVKSGDGADVVSSQDIWAKRYIYESGLRVYSPNNKPTAGDVGAYTKGESDGRYQPHGNYQSAGNYQPTGNYAVRGECYTRGESDGRYLQKDAGTRRTQEIVVWNGRVQDQGDMVCTESIAGCLVYIRTTSGQWLPLEVPVNQRVFSTQWPGNWWGRIEFIPPSTLRWQNGAQIMNQVILSK